MKRDDETPAAGVRALREAGFHPRKSLGQNFLINSHVLERIVDSVGLGPGDRVVEIGSGPGTMTGLLADRAEEVISVEIEGELIDKQKERLCERRNIRFVHADFLDVDLAEFAEGRKIVVVGNIPYSATSPIIIRILEQADLVDRAYLLMQKEVADRIASPPGSRRYGRISVAVQYHSAPRTLFKVKPSAFSPRPRVDSALLHLDMYETLPARPVDEKLMFELIKQLFQSRRKMIRSGLRSFGELDLEALDRVERESGIPLSSRPEVLGVADWCRLSDAMGGVA